MCIRDSGNIFLSYIKQNGNFQENEVIQRGVWWGLLRVIENNHNPNLLNGLYSTLQPYLTSQDPVKRGLSAKIIGLLKIKEEMQTLETLLKDNTVFKTFIDGKLIELKISETAKDAISRINSKG